MELLLELYKIKKEELNALHFNLLENFQNFNSKNIFYNLQIFKNSEFGAVRALVIDGEPWMVGKDVAEALGYTDVAHAILDHVDEEDRVNSKTQGQNAPELGQRGSWLINESGLYSLVLSSKLQTAKKFKRWVTGKGQQYFINKFIEAR